MVKIYDEPTKELFLNQFSPKTAKTYRNVFTKTFTIEEKFNKDLSKFNLDDVAEVMNLIKPKTKQSSRSYGRVITKYNSWRNGKDFKVPQKFFDQFVPKQSNLYFKKSSIDYVIKHLVNDSDALIIKLLFEGVEGKEASEIRNLKITDCKSDFIVVCDDKHLVVETKEGEERKYYTKDAVRAVPIEKDTLRLIKRSHNEPDYWRKNAQAEGRANGRMELPSAYETPYVIKTAKTQGKHYMSKASQYTIYNRIEMIGNLDWGDIDPEAFTTKNIKRSGMIYEAYKILKDGGELDNDSIDYICKKYNVAGQWYVKDFLNSETVEDIYGKIKKSTITVG